MVSLSCNLEMVIYHGTIPPLNNIVKNTKKASLFRYLKSRRDRGYAIMEINSRLKIIPATDTNMEIKYELIICMGFLKMIS